MLRRPAAAAGWRRPPTLLPEQAAVGRSLSPLVQTYATVPYPDVDPTLLASLAYVLMFGMMFGDVGHGAMLALVAVYLASPWSARRPLLGRVRKAWPFVLGGGVAAMGSARSTASSSVRPEWSRLSGCTRSTSRSG